MITPELIHNSPQFINENGERQLDLRRNNLAAISSLGASLNFFQSIDLSDNLIRSLNNFSYLDGLTTLIAANNWISSLSDLSHSLPNLENLFLMNNKLADIKEIDKLRGCLRLKRLVLVSYREAVIGRLTTLQVLDFKKIAKKQRKDAEALVKKDLELE